MKDHPNLMTSETELFNVPKALQNPIKKAVFIKFLYSLWVSYKP